MISLMLVFWPGSGDQIQTANALTHNFDVGVELLQVRNGYNVGRWTALGVLVEGTEQAMRKEFQEVFEGMVGGERGKRLRENIRTLGEEVRRDSVEGESRKDMLRLAAA